MDKTPDPRLAELTGEAIKLMVEAGASASVVGHFAIHYPALVASKLEPLPAPQELDLEAIIRATVQTVLGTRVAPHADKTSAGEPASTTRRRGPRDAERVKINVTAQGKRTSVKVRTALLEQLRAVPDGPAPDELIQSFIDQAPVGHPNRSAWVEEQATQFLVLQRMTTDQAAGH